MTIRRRRRPRRLSLIYNRHNIVLAATATML
jgi:hypothetical protein